MIEYVPVLASVWKTALPEAIGGGAVAVVLLGAQMVHGRFSRKMRIARAKSAALTEVEAIWVGASSVAVRTASAATIQPLQSASLSSLVRVAMELIGDPEIEASLGRLSDELGLYNALVLRLTIESSGVSRAMGDHASAVAGLEHSIRESADRIIVTLSEFKLLLKSK